MNIYCGMDFHARQQIICDCDATDGVIQLTELDHETDDVRGFYAGLKGEVIVVLGDVFEPIPRIPAATA